MRSSRWRWRLDEVFVKVNGLQHYSAGPRVKTAKCSKPLSLSGAIRRQRLRRENPF